jgi:TRAP-type C4-dicarboxylate transport system permease small subunit
VRIVDISRRLNVWMNTLAGWVLLLMMMLTVADVIMRSAGSGILGTYELVAVAGALVIGFAIPQTSFEKGHVYVDFLIENRPAAIKKSVLFITRIMGTMLFALLAWNLLIKGINLYKGGEVSLTLHVPYYPASFALSFCCFVQCLTLITDIIRIFDGRRSE